MYILNVYALYGVFIIFRRHSLWNLYFERCDEILLSVHAKPWKLVSADLTMPQPDNMGMWIRPKLLSNMCTRMNFCWSVKFIHRWTTVVHVTLRVSDASDKWYTSSWLAEVTFVCRHVMETDVERNNRTQPVVLQLFFADYFTRITSKLQRWIACFWHSSKYERNGSCRQVKWYPSLVTYFARDPLNIASTLRWMSVTWKLCHKWITICINKKCWKVDSRDPSFFLS